MRDAFRRFRAAAGEEAWDWHAAGVPEALTAELEARKAEKDAKKKEKDKARKKAAPSKGKVAFARASSGPHAV